MSETIHSQVQEYYGETLKSSADLQTNACCLGNSAIPKSQKEVLGKIHTEILTKFYGCGSPIPEGVEGSTVLDLGCGTGRDVYLASALVGEKGKVIGIDMTQQQLEVAKKYQEYHREQFGLKESNVDFRLGNIEDLSQSNIKDESIDVVISNCVLNLCSNKEKAFREIWRVLKWGGELYFSDVYSDRRIPLEFQQDKTLWGECLSGALYLEDFRRVMQKIGFLDFRVISKSDITIGNPEIQKLMGPIKFYSITYRAFKIQGIEDKCEDFGQTLQYKGTLKDHPESFTLDDHHEFKKDQVYRVCGNSASMIADTRFAPHFTVTPRGLHLGLFDCSPKSGDNESEDCDKNGKGGCGNSGSCC